MPTFTVTAPSARPGAWKRRLATGRAALAEWARQGATVASAARHRYRRPALVIGSFGCIDAAAWHSLGMGAGLLVLGALGLVFEAIGGDE
jgi:hypothetical protein